MRETIEAIGEICLPLARELGLRVSRPSRFRRGLSLRRLVP